MIANNYLEVQGHEDSVFALGDCASITDPNTGNPCPPTAQHALRRGKIAAKVEEVKVKMKDYGVRAVPTTIIDGKINRYS